MSALHLYLPLSQLLPQFLLASRAGAIVGLPRFADSCKFLSSVCAGVGRANGQRAPLTLNYDEELYALSWLSVCVCV